MILRRLILAALVIAAGCATPEGQVILGAGESACFDAHGRREPMERCKSLLAIRDSLRTPEMERAIAEAVRGKP